MWNLAPILLVKSARSNKKPTLFSPSLLLRFASLKVQKLEKKNLSNPKGQNWPAPLHSYPPPLGHSKKMAGILFRMKIFDILQALLNFYLLTRNRFWNFSFIIIITPFTPSHTSSPSSAPPLSPDGRTQCFSFFSLVFRFLSLI